MRKLLPLFLLVPVLTLSFAFAEERTAVADDAVAPLYDETEYPDGLDVDVARDFRLHCVRVFVSGRPFDGQRPATASFDEDIRNERPTPLGGYWWDETHVVVPDPVIQDRFIDYIEVQLPSGGTRYPARVAGRFVKLQALLLEVGPDADGDYPEAHPLEFVDGPLDEAFVLSYGLSDGEWRIVAGGGLDESALNDNDVVTIALKKDGVIVDDFGNALGLAFGDRVILDEEESYWAGRELHYTPIISSEEAATANEAMRRRLANAVLETRFRFRVKVDDDDDEDDDESAMWAMNVAENQARAAKAEVRAAGLVVGRQHLLVPIPLAAGGILRIEDITVVTPSGRELEAEFVGALREYLAVLVKVKQNLPTRNLPRGFASLNPAGPGDRDEPLRKDSPLLEFFHRWRVDYALGHRREVADYDRWQGTLRSYRDDPVVLTLTNESDGSMAFDTEGNLAALALTPRLIKSSDPGLDLDYEASPGFRPLDFLARKLADDEVFDPFLMPVDGKQGRRLVDMGVEVQPLDANTAQLFKVARESRGGSIGALVTHVYPGSIAAEIGLREHDVLLRIFVEGRSEAMELRPGSSVFHGIFDPGDMSSESFQSMLQYMPPPWPPRDNVISALLTSAGPGRKATVDYMRDGEPQRAAFVTGYFEPDYRNARKERFTTLGLTAKAITFEVARYFSRSDDSGVIVSKVEEGGKGSVAGLHHYLLITHVDGRPVAGLDDFRDKVAAFEAGEAGAVELTVESFGKTRLVKIE